jgi:hypothetical protein
MTWALDNRDGTTRWAVQGAGNLRHVRYLKKYGNKGGVWLLAGDDRSSLLVDDEGRVQGVIEQAGPVSALHVCDSNLFLATLSGRLLRMGNAAYTLTNSTSVSTVEKASLYPIRQDVQMSEAELLYRLTSTDCWESFAAMKLLIQIAEFIASSSVKDDLISAIPQFFFDPRQTLERRILFMYRLREAWVQEISHLPVNNAHFTLEFLESCWKKLYDESIQQSSGLQCKLVSPLLDILDALAKVSPVEQQAYPLRKTIRAALWQNQNCPLILLKPDGGLSAIRLNQARKRWDKILTEFGKERPTANEVDNPKLLFAWCNALADESGVVETEDLVNCLRLLSEPYLRLLPKEDSFWQWLEKLAISKSNDSFPLPPAPLSRLMEPSFDTLTGQWRDKLANLFDDNIVWLTWLDNLRGILTSLQINNQAEIHYANREYDDWVRLKEHIEAGKIRFSVSQSQSLLALFWPMLMKQWEGFIQQGLQVLENKIFSYPDQYLVLHIRDRWQGNHMVVLAIQFENRFRGLLQLQAFSWQGNTLIEAGLPLLLPTGENRPEHQLTLEANDNRLHGLLELRCREVETGRTLLVAYEVNIDRGISRLSSSPAWEASWQHLLLLLEDYANHGQGFAWVDGGIWTTEERSRLKEDVEYKYGVKVDTRSRGWAEGLPLFSPDLALDAEAEQQLSQLHSLLPSLAQCLSQSRIGKNGRLFWALALWRWVKGLPPSIEKVLESYYPNHLQLTDKAF